MPTNPYVLCTLYRPLDTCAATPNRVGDAEACVSPACSCRLPLASCAPPPCLAASTARPDVRPSTASGSCSTFTRRVRSRRCWRRWSTCSATPSAAAWRTVCMDEWPVVATCTFVIIFRPCPCTSKANVIGPANAPAPHPSPGTCKSRTNPCRLYSHNVLFRTAPPRTTTGSLQGWDCKRTWALPLHASDDRPHTVGNARHCRSQRRSVECRR